MSVATAQPLAEASASLPPEVVSEAVGADSLYLDGVSKQWSRKQAPVLDEVEFEAVPGTATWIGGSNGAGKTTLLRIATGAIRPDAGSVTLHGLSPERDRRAFQSRISYLAAGDKALYARLSVWRHLELWGCLALLPKARRNEAIKRSLEEFGLTELAHRRVDRLSLGQRQRVRIAGAFLHDPTIALLDEPHNSLDPDGLHTLVAACMKMVGRGGTVIWCSPALEHADLRFDRQYWLENGKLEER
jgi:ABC-type multidrug transport system ATPase subunit